MNISIKKLIIISLLLVFCIGAVSAAENTNSHLNDNTNNLSLSDNLNQNEIENGVISNSEGGNRDNDMPNHLTDSSDTLNANDLSNSLGPLGVNEDDVSSDIGLNDDDSNVDDNIEIDNGKIPLQSSPDIPVLTASNVIYVGQNITAGGEGTESNPYNNLKLALSHAGENDTIKILDGVYAGANNTGITISVKGLTIEAAGDNVVFDGNYGSNKFFTVNSNNVTIKGITFKDTRVYSNGGSIYWGGTNGTIDSCKFIDTNVSSSYYGGAVYWNGANGTIKNTDFSDISAYNGGAVYWYGADGTISNCHFDNVSSINYGGAVYWYGTRGKINDSEFDNVKSKSYGGAVYWSGSYGELNNSEFNNISASSSYGGAVYWYGSYGILNNSEFNNTRAGYGGAVYWSGSYGKINNTGINNSNASSSGGAIYRSSSGSLENTNISNTYATTSGGAVYLSNGGNITNCSFTNTSSKSSGGALYIDGSYANVSNSQFKDTVSNSSGGAIYWYGNYGNLTNSQFTNSRAQSGGTIYSNSRDLYLFNNTMEESFANNTGQYIYNGLTIKNPVITFIENSTVDAEEHKGYNASVVVTDDMGNPIYGGSVNVFANGEKIGSVDITDNESSIIVYPLNETALINGTYTRGSATVNTGVINFPNPYSGPYYVDPNGDDMNDGSVDHPFKTIEAAIRAASRENATHAIFINEGKYNESNLNVPTGLNITGLGDVTINANKSGNIFYISGSNTNISNINFVNGSSANGGAIEWSGSNGNISNCTFENNKATNGGAIYNSGNSNLLTNCTFKGNTATNGGTIFNKGNLTISKNEIASSSASVGKFIYNNGTLNGLVLTFLDNNTVVCEEHKNAAVNVTVTDDMGTPVHGGQISFTLNGEEIISADIKEGFANAIVNPISSGDNLVSGNYPGTPSQVNTGLIKFEGTPYSGPYYVDPNGDDSNDGSPEHPLKSIKTALELAAHGTPSVIINEGEYQENKIDIKRPVNITGSGNPIINGGKNNIFNVSAKDVNISNINFENASSSNGGAVYWAGSYGSLTNCSFENCNATGNGGAVYWAGSSGKIVNSTFENCNATGNGGAVYWAGSNGIVDNSSFNNNTAKSNGGAVYWNGANGAMSNSNFTNNDANSSSSKGGAVYWATASGKINNCSFENNTVNTTSSSSFGGAAYIAGGSTTINGSSFNGNDAFSGGSLYVAGSSVNVNNSNFSEDHADHFGGSIFWNGGSGRLINSTISNSSANHMGGAVFWQGSSGRIDGSNLTENYASDGGAIYDTGSSLTVANSNLKDNEARYGGAIFTTASSLSIQGSNITDNHANITAGGIAHRYAFTNTSSIIVNNTPEDREPVSPDGSAFVYVNSSSSSSYNNASLSDGYFGYCINSHRSATGKNNPLTVASMSEVTNSVNGLPVGEYLKILFYNYYESVNQNRIWYFTDEDFFKSSDSIVKKVIEDYNSGLRIPDHGAKKRVNKTSYRYYDFEALLSTNVANQNLFGYRVSYEDIIFNISVVKESLNKTVYEDQQTEFDIRVTNTGNYLLEDVFVLEDKYEGLVFDHYEDPEGNWNFDEQLHKWIFKGVLDVGETTTIRVVFNVTSPGNFTNFIVAGANETENKTANNTTKVYNSSLIVEKITLTPIVPVGNQTKFLIVVTNRGESDLDGVYVKETSYEGLVYDSFIDPSGKWSFDGNDCWKYNGTLESGKSANFTVVFYTVTPGNFTNIVVAGSDHTNETTSNNTTKAYNCSLIVEKITLTPIVPVGNQTKFLIVVTNTGEGDLDGVYVKETSYEGLVYDSFIDPSGKWSFDGNNRWNYQGVLGAGESANFTVVFYTVTPGNFTNIVVAGSDYTNETTANNTTEVFNDTEEDTNKTDKEVHNDKETKKAVKVVAGVTAGNPLLVLILSLISLCIVPLNRKK